jgi:outer membrane protein assembly factor BamB
MLHRDGTMHPSLPLNRFRWYGWALKASLPYSLLVAVILTAAPASVGPEWSQWGGPNRDFTVDGKGLVASWPDTGPKKLWSRPLGEGYSSIAVSGGMLFTLYRRDNQEVVIALDAASGKTRWEFVYAAAFLSGMDMQNGPGPSSTPLVLNGRVYTVGVTGKFHCLDQKTGKLIWAHDLIKEFNGTVLQRGYSASPIAHRQSVIVPVGGKGHAVISFEQQSGRVLWAKQDFDNSNSSPMFIQLGDQKQLLLFLAREIVGLNPDTGDLLWTHPHVTQWNLNITMPVWNGNVLFCSSGYDGGSRGLELTQSGAKTVVKELWANPRLRINFTNTIRIGEHIYGSSGDFGPAFLSAVNIKTGKLAWQNRSYPKLNLISAGGKVVLLDEDGNLMLASISPESVQIISKAKVLENNSWTPPSLVGSTLYLRDRKTIMAMDLS